MKRITTTGISMLMITVVIALSSCGKEKWPCIDGNGEIISQTRSISGFTSVSSEMQATVHITQGVEFEVRLEAQQNILDDIRTSLSGDELEIYSEHCIDNALPVHIYVTMPEVNSLSLSGSGGMITQGKVTATNLEIDISGSGSFTAGDTIIASSINMEISGSGSMDLIADAPLVTSDISGSGDVTITGLGNTLTSEISGSGKVKAFYFYTSTSHVQISGSGDMELNATDLIDGSISGSGDLYYKNSPVISLSISGSGELIHVD